MGKRVRTPPLCAVCGKPTVSGASAADLRLSLAVRGGQRLEVGALIGPCCLDGAEPDPAKLMLLLRLACRRTLALDLS